MSSSQSPRPRAAGAPSWADVVEAAFDAVITMDGEGLVTGWNSEAERAFGWTREEAVGQRLADLIIPERYSEAHAEGLRRFLRTGYGRIIGQRLELSGLHKDGHELPVELTVSAIALEDGWHFCAFVRDLSATRQAERVLRSTERRLRAVIESEPECVKVIDEAGRLVEMNPAGLAMIDAPRLDVVLGTDLSVLVVPEDREAFRALTRRVFRGEPGTLEFDIVSLKGVRRRLETHAVPLPGPEGEVTGLLGVTRDVTQQRRIERTQAASYRISEAAHVAGSLGELSRAIHQIIGELLPAANFFIALYDRETSSIRFPYFVDERDPPPGTRPFGRGLTEHVIRSGRPLFADPETLRALEAAGEVELIGTDADAWAGVPLIQDGQTFGALVVQSYAPGARFGEAERDLLTFVSSQVAMVIARKRAEERLRDSEASHRALVEHAGFGIYRATAEGRFLVVNPALVRMLGYDSEQQVLALDVGRDVYDTPAERQRVNHSLREDPTRAVEVTWKRRDASRITVHVTGQATLGAAGDVVWYDVFAEDVTERQARQAQVLQAQRLEAIGRLAGGIAHDFNNLLTAILGSTDLLLATLEPESAGRRDAGEIRSAAMRAAELTRQLLAFSRRQMMLPRPLDLNGIVRGMDSLLRRLIGEHLELRLTLAPELPSVEADAGQLEQMLTNLVLNARDAMPDGGTVSIETGTTELSSGPTAPWTVAAGTYVTLTVSDTGHGIDAETRRHLFEPFLTTKAVGAGTGLGLATVYGIVKQSGGHILVESEVGRGSSFRVCLPAVAAKPAPPLPAPPAAVGGNETVLLVEDEPGVRNLVTRTLQAHGYRVLAAASGQQALELAHRHEGPIDLLATDVVMPGMSGPDLARQLIAERPSLPVLFMSGYMDDALRHHGVLQGSAPLVQKPFTTEGLLQVVRKVLDDAGG